MNNGRQMGNNRQTMLETKDLLNGPSRGMTVSEALRGAKMSYSRSRHRKREFTGPRLTFRKPSPP